MSQQPQEPLILYRLNAIETDVRAVRVTVEDMNNRMLTKERESMQRDADVTSAQDRLQIKVLVGILLLFLSVVSSLLVFYITHR